MIKNIISTIIFGLVVVATLVGVVTSSALASTCEQSFEEPGPKAFAQAMTKNYLLRPEQEGLFTFYIQHWFSKPDNTGHKIVYASCLK